MNTNYTLLKTTVVALFFSYTSWSQATIAQWNFNGTSATEVAGGGTSPLPVSGSGTIGLVGVVSTSTPPFATGLGNTANPAPSSDPIPTNPTNFAWAITNYPTLGIGNKQSGIQVNVNTVGYADITFKFDQRLSNKAGNTYVVQYTADRTIGNPVWVDAQTFTFTPAETGTGDLWYNLRTVDLSAVSALNNNANVAFRVVASFDLITGDYLASKSTSTYDGLGVTRFDMVTVSAATTLGTTSFESAKNNFKMFPNPSNKEMVQFNVAQDVSVFDILGKLILKAKNTTTIDTKSFRSGVYVVKTKSGITRKLIVR